jgi:RHS repeat-associated protein
MIKGNNFYYYHYDGLGNVRAITDASGAVVETYTYDVYGKPTIHKGTGTQEHTSTGEIIPESQIGNPFFFTGKMFDSTTGLYYYRNRYYDPELGRFITPDPVGPVDGPNLYTYVGNNPVNYVDPLGLCWGKATIYAGGDGIHIGVEIEGAGPYSGSWGFYAAKEERENPALYLGLPVEGRVYSDGGYSYRIPVSNDMGYIMHTYYNIQSSIEQSNRGGLTYDLHGVLDRYDYNCYDWTGDMLWG